MMHLDDGTLQAFLDDELDVAERAAVAEHLLGCGDCQASHDTLTRANALFMQSVSMLDMEPTVLASGAAPARRQGWRSGPGTASFVRAAALVVVLAAAASAAVPGSPVREWVVRAVAGPVEETSAPAEPAVVPPAEVPPAPAGLAIEPSDGALTVALSRLSGMEIQLEALSGPRATVRVVGARQEPSFGTGPGRLEVREGAGGTVSVGLPVGVEGARLEMDGVLCADAVGGTLRIHVPADTVAGVVTFR
jgi:anti-sigma factor RsiW